MTAAGEERPLGGKAANVALAAGDALVVETSGGGGLGPAGERDPALVDADLRAGRVTPEGAADYLRG